MILVKYPDYAYRPMYVPIEFLLAHIFIVSA